jgi:hypothetical protein
VAERDLSSINPAEPHAETRAGLIGFARLLSSVDPYRVRWALQHVPYRLAKSMRNLIGTTAKRRPTLESWESGLLLIAWRQLFDEGRISTGWGVRS